jgi:hypothetical protein
MQLPAANVIRRPCIQFDHDFMILVSLERADTAGQHLVQVKFL